MRYHVIYSVFCMMIYVARGSWQVPSEFAGPGKTLNFPADSSGKYARESVNCIQVGMSTIPQMHFSRSLLSISPRSDEKVSKRYKRQSGPLMDSSRDVKKEEIGRNASTFVSNNTINYSRGSVISHDNKDTLLDTKIADIEGHRAIKKEEIAPENVLSPDKPVWQVQDSPKQFVSSRSASAESSSLLKHSKPSEDHREDDIVRRNIISSRQKKRQPDQSQMNVDGFSQSENMIQPYQSNLVSPEQNVPGRDSQGPFTLDHFAPGETLHFHTQFKRGFQLVPVTRNLYILKEDTGEPEERSAEDDSQFIVLPRQSMVNNENYGTNSGDRTSAMLSFKAHMHHDVKDIGNNFRRKVSEKNLRFADSNDLPMDIQDSFNVGSSSSSMIDQYQNPAPLIQENQQNVVPIRNQNYPQFVDPLANSFNNNPVLDNIKMYGGNNLLYNPNPRSAQVVPANFYQDQNLGLQYPNNQISYNSFNRDAPYQPLQQGSPMGISYGTGLNDLNVLDRGTRDNPEDSGTYRLKYLDRYAKALNSMNENYSNDLERISSEAENSENLADDNSFGQESLNDIENENQNDNSVNPREISSSNDRSRLPVASSNIIKELPNWESDVYQYPNPSYIPQKILDSRQFDDNSIVSSSISSIIGEANPSIDDPQQVEPKGKSFSTVIEPLTAQLQKLLSTIKLVNQNLTSEQNSGNRESEEMRNKRWISSEKTRAKRHEKILNDVEEVDPLAKVIKRVNPEEEIVDLTLHGAQKNSLPSQNLENKSVTEFNNEDNNKLKRNPGIMDFIEKTFGFGQKNNQSVTKTTGSVFETTNFEDLDTETSEEIPEETNIWSTTQEEYSSDVEESSGRLESSTISSTRNIIAMSTEIVENRDETTETLRKTTNRNHENQVKFTSSGTTISVEKSDESNTAETEEMDDRSTYLDGNDENNNVTVLSTRVEEETSTRQGMKSSWLSDKIASSKEREKINLFLESVLDSKSKKNSSEAVDNKSVTTFQPETTLIRRPNTEGHQSQNKLGPPSTMISIPNKINAPVEVIHQISTMEEEEISSKNDSQPQEFSNRNLFFPTFAEESPKELQTIGMSLEPSEKFGEQRIGINYVELDKARQSGAQDFLIKLLSPEIIKNITKDGVIVRVPDRISNSSLNSLRNGSSNFQRIRTKLRDSIPKTSAGLTSLFQPAISFQSELRRRSKLHESKVRDGENTAMENNHPSLSKNSDNLQKKESSITHHRSIISSTTQTTKSKTNEDAVVAVSGDDTGGNARVDIRLKIPIHNPEKRRKIVTRESDILKTNMSPKITKRSDYKNYDNAEDYEDYIDLGKYDSLDDYDLQDLDSSDAEEAYAQYVEALEPEEVYEDDYEPEEILDDLAYDSRLEKNKMTLGVEKHNPKTSKLHHIWPEHVGEKYLPKMDAADSLTPLYQTPKKSQGHRSGHKNRLQGQDGVSKQKKVRKPKTKISSDDKKKKHKSKPTKFDKPGYVRLGRRLQSILEGQSDDEFGEFENEMPKIKNVDDTTLLDDDIAKQLMMMTPVEDFLTESSGPTEFTTGSDRQQVDAYYNILNMFDDTVDNPEDITSGSTEKGMIGTTKNPNDETGTSAEKIATTEDEDKEEETSVSTLETSTSITTEVSEKAESDETVTENESLDDVIESGESLTSEEMSTDVTEGTKGRSEVTDSVGSVATETTEILTQTSEIVEETTKVSSVRTSTEIASSKATTEKMEVTEETEEEITAISSVSAQLEITEATTEEVEVIEESSTKISTEELDSSVDTSSSEEETSSHFSSAKISSSGSSASTIESEITETTQISTKSMEKIPTSTIKGVTSAGYFTKDTTVITTQMSETAKQKVITSPVIGETTTVKNMETIKITTVGDITTDSTTEIPITTLSTIAKEATNVENEEANPVTEETETTSEEIKATEMSEEMSLETVLSTDDSSTKMSVTASTLEIIGTSQGVEETTSSSETEDTSIVETSEKISTSEISLPTETTTPAETIASEETSKFSEVTGEETESTMESTEEITKNEKTETEATTESTETSEISSSEATEETTESPLTTHQSTEIPTTEISSTAILSATVAPATSISATIITKQQKTTSTYFPTTVTKKQEATSSQPKTLGLKSTSTIAVTTKMEETSTKIPIIVTITAPETTETVADDLSVKTETQPTKTTINSSRFTDKISSTIVASSRETEETLIVTTVPENFSTDFLTTLPMTSKSVKTTAKTTDANLMEATELETEHYETTEMKTTKETGSTESRTETTIQEDDEFIEDTTSTESTSTTKTTMMMTLSTQTEGIEEETPLSTELNEETTQTTVESSAQIIKGISSTESKKETSESFSETPSKATTISEVPITIEVPSLTEVLTSTEAETTTKITTKIEMTTTNEGSSTTEVPTTTEHETATEVSTTIEIPTTTEVPIATEVPTTTEVSIATQVPTTTEVTSTTEVPSTTEVSSTSEVSDTSEISSTIEVSSTSEVTITTQVPSTSETTEEQSTASIFSETAEITTQFIHTTTEMSSTEEILDITTPLLFGTSTELQSTETTLQIPTTTTEFYETPKIFTEETSLITAAATSTTMSQKTTTEFDIEDLELETVTQAEEEMEIETTSVTEEATIYDEKDLPDEDEEAYEEDNETEEPEESTDWDDYEVETTEALVKSTKKTAKNLMTTKMSAEPEVSEIAGLVPMSEERSSLSTPTTTVGLTKTTASMVTNKAVTETTSELKQTTQEEMTGESSETLPLTVTPQPTKFQEITKPDIVVEITEETTVETGESAKNSFATTEIMEPATTKATTVVEDYDDYHETLTVKEVSEVSTATLSKSSTTATYSSSTISSASASDFSSTISSGSTSEFTSTITSETGVTEKIVTGSETTLTLKNNEVEVETLSSVTTQSGFSEISKEVPDFEKTTDFTEDNEAITIITETDHQTTVTIDMYETMSHLGDGVTAAKKMSTSETGGTEKFVTGSETTLTLKNNEVEVETLSSVTTQSGFSEISKEVSDFEKTTDFTEDNEAITIITETDNQTSVTIDMYETMSHLGDGVTAAKKIPTSETGGTEKFVTGSATTFSKMLVPSSGLPEEETAVSELTQSTSSILSTSEAIESEIERTSSLQEELETSISTFSYTESSTSTSSTKLSSSETFEAEVSEELATKTMKTSNGELLSSIFEAISTTMSQLQSVFSSSETSTSSYASEEIETKSGTPNLELSTSISVETSEEVTASSGSSAEKEAISTNEREFTTEGFTTEGFTTEVFTAEELTTEKLIADEFTTQEFTTEKLTTEEFTTQEFTTEKLITEEFTTQEFTTDKLTTEEFTTEVFTTEKILTDEFTIEEFTTEELLTIGAEATEKSTSPLIQETSVITVEEITKTTESPETTLSTTPLTSEETTSVKSTTSESSTLSEATIVIMETELEVTTFGTTMKTLQSHPEEIEATTGLIFTEGKKVTEEEDYEVETELYTETNEPEEDYDAEYEEEVEEPSTKDWFEYEEGTTESWEHPKEKELQGTSVTQKEVKITTEATELKTIPEIESSSSTLISTLSTSILGSSVFTSAAEGTIEEESSSLENDLTTSEEEEEESTKRTTEFITRPTEENIMITSSLPEFEEETAPFKPIMPVLGTTTEFEMIVTIPKFLERPEESSLEPLDETTIIHETSILMESSVGTTEETSEDFFLSQSDTTVAFPTVDKQFVTGFSEVSDFATGGLQETSLFIEDNEAIGVITESSDKTTGEIEVETLSTVTSQFGTGFGEISNEFSDFTEGLQKTSHFTEDNEAITIITESGEKTTGEVEVETLSSITTQSGFSEISKGVHDFATGDLEKTTDFTEDNKAITISTETDHQTTGEVATSFSEEISENTKPELTYETSSELEEEITDRSKILEFTTSSLVTIDMYETMSHLGDGVTAAKKFPESTSSEEIISPSGDIEEVTESLEMISSEYEDISKSTFNRQSELTTEIVESSSESEFSTRTQLDNTNVIAEEKSTEEATETGSVGEGLTNENEIEKGTSVEELTSRKTSPSPKTAEDMESKEKELREKEKEQKERRKNIQESMKELEKKEKELLEREADLEKKRKEWKEQKEQREREREKIEKEKKTTTEMSATLEKTTTEEIAETTIDAAKVQRLEETKIKQDELEDELKNLERELQDKEIMLKEKEEELKSKELEHEREKEEFEREWQEEREEEIAHKEKELEDKERKLEEVEEKLMEEKEKVTFQTTEETTNEESTIMEKNEVTSKNATLFSKTSVHPTEHLSTKITTIKPVVETIAPTPMPPIEETTLTKFSSTKMTTKSIESDVTRNKSLHVEPEEEGKSEETSGGEDDEEPEDEESDDYVFDEDEEVWKEKQPDDYDRETDKVEYEEGCDAESQLMKTGIDFTTPVSKHFEDKSTAGENLKGKSTTNTLENEENGGVNGDLEAATKKVCLHVLQNDSVLSDARKHSKDFVTEIVCLPYNPEETHGRGRVARKLMDHNDESSSSRSTSGEVLKKRHGSPDDKERKIYSLNIIGQEWKNDENTPALHTLKGFTRVYESWSEVPKHVVTLRMDDEEQDDEVLVVNDEKLKNKFKVNKSGNRVRATEVGRLNDLEWNEGPTERLQTPASTSIGSNDAEENNLDVSGDEEMDSIESERGRRNNDKNNETVISNPEDIPQDYHENCQLQLQELKRTGGESGENFLTPLPPVETDEEDESDEEEIFDDADGEKENYEAEDEEGGGTEEEEEAEGEEEEKDRVEEQENEEDADEKGEEKEEEDVDEEKEEEKGEEKEEEDVDEEKEKENEKEEEKEEKKDDENDYGEIEYVTDDEIDLLYPEDDDYSSDENGENENSKDESEDADEPQWQNYDEKDTSNPEESEGMQKTGKARAKSEKKMLHHKENVLLEQQAKLTKKENNVKSAERKLKNNEEALTMLKKQTGTRTLRRRKILESEEFIPDSWPTESSGRYHIGGIEGWVTAEVDDEDSFRKNKQAFTVNVLRLEYDEDEENHKMKCVPPPNPEEMVVQLGRVTKSEEEGNVSVDDAEDDELVYDDPEESNGIAKNEGFGPTEPLDGATLVTTRRNLKKNVKERHPPGSEWPTERTTRYHVGGTLTWDKELLGRPIETREVREAIPEENEYLDDSEEYYGVVEDEKGRGRRDDVQRTTCYTVIVKSGKTALRRNLEKYMKGMKRSEEQIERPEYIRIHQGHRWRTIDDKELKRRKRKPAKTLKRDVLGRRLNFFDVSHKVKLPEGFSANFRSSTDNFVNLKPKLRTIKSIERPEVNMNIEYDEDNEDDDEDDNNYEDDSRNFVRDVSNDHCDASRESTGYFPVDDNYTTQVFDFYDDHFSAPTEPTMTNMRFDVTEGLATSRLVQQFGIGEAKKVTDVLSTVEVSDGPTNVKVPSDSSVFGEILGVENSTRPPTGYLEEGFTNFPDDENIFYDLITEGDTSSDSTIDNGNTFQTTEKIIETSGSIIDSVNSLEIMGKNIETSSTVLETLQLTTDKTLKSSNELHHFFGEYADYGQDLYSKKKISTSTSSSSINLENNERIRKEMDTKTSNDNTTPQQNLFNVKTENPAKMNNRKNHGFKIPWFKSDLTTNKVSPIFVRLDEAKFLELKNLEEPPKEIYVLYKCGPPIVIGAYSSTEKSSITSKPELRTTPMEKSITDDQTKSPKQTLQEFPNDIENPGVINHPTDVSFVQKSNYEKMSTDVTIHPEEITYDPEDGGPVPLCGGFVDNEFARSLTVNSAKTTHESSSELFEITGEPDSTTPETIKPKDDGSYTGNAMILFPTGSSTSREILERLFNRGPPILSSKKPEIGKIEKKTSRPIKKIIDYSYARKGQPESKEFLKRNIKTPKKISAMRKWKKKPKKGIKKKKQKKPLNRSARSIDSRGNNSVETWEIEVDPERKDTTIKTRSNDEMRRNAISDDSQESRVWYDYLSDYADYPDKLRSHRSLLGVQKNLRRKNMRKIIAHKSRMKMKPRFLRDLRKKSLAEEKQSGFRKSPALDSGVLEDDDNPIETSSLLDKVMNMIKPKSETVQLEDAEEGRTKEEKPRSLLQKVKEIIGNAIGIGKKNNEVTSFVVGNNLTTLEEKMTTEKVVVSRIPKKIEASKKHSHPEEHRLHEHLKNKKVKPEKNHSHHQISSRLESVTMKKLNAHEGKKKLSSKSKKPSVLAPIKRHRHVSTPRHFKSKKTHEMKNKKSNVSRKKSAMTKKMILEKNKIAKLKSNHVKSIFVPEITSKPVNINSQHGKLVFKNEVKALNVSSIIPRVRKLVEKQNLGSVEKIIVYVDKNEKKRNDELSTISSVKIRPITHSGKELKSAKNETLKTKRFKTDLVARKVHDNMKKRNFDIAEDRKNSHLSEISDDNFSNEIETGKLSFDGVSLDEIVSRVADEILKNIDNHQDQNPTMDPRISVKVIQEVANGTELPHEETRTEFMLDMSGNPISDFPKRQKFKGNNNSKHKVAFRSPKKSMRLVSRSSKRRMNLPILSRKKKRRNWLNKIKREEADEEERNLQIIRRRLLRELSQKMKNRRIRRFREKSRHRRSLYHPRDRLLRKINTKKKLKNSSKHHLSDIDEKIRIIYAMRHKKDKKPPRKNVVKSKKNKAAKNHHWRSILPLRAAGRHKKRHQTKIHTTRNKRENDFLHTENLYDGIKKIVGRNVDSTSLENQNEIIEKNIMSENSEFPWNISSAISSGLSKSRRSAIKSANLDIGDAKTILPVDKTLKNNNTIFYDHMLQLQKKLLKKSSSSPTNSSITIKDKHAKSSRSTCTKNCNICAEKYERVKNLVHAGTHYLLRRFDDCERCKRNSCDADDSSLHQDSPRETKTKREDIPSSEVENMAEKILHFASKIDGSREKNESVREANDENLDGLIEKFGIDELGLTSEDDRKSLAMLVNEIVNVQKNVNETLQIIRKRLGKEGSTTKSGKSRKKSIAKKKTTKKKLSNKKKTAKKPKHKNKSIQKKKKKSKKTNSKNHKSEKKKANAKTKKVKKRKVEKKNSSNKKKLENHVDKVDEEIREILIEEGDPKSTVSSPLKKQNIFANSSRKIRDAGEFQKNHFYLRYPRDIEDTNVASSGKYRSRKIRSSLWNRAEDAEDIFNEVKNFPNLLDLTNVSFNLKKKSAHLNSTSVSSLLTSPTISNSTKHLSSVKTSRKNGKGHEKMSVSSKESKKKPDSGKRVKNRQRLNKKVADNVEEVTPTLKNEKKHINDKSPKLSSSFDDQGIKLRLSGRLNVIEETRRNKENPKKPTSHFSIQRKLQSSPQMLKKKSNKKSTQSKKFGETKKHSADKNFKTAKLKKTLKRNHRGSSQTMVPIENGHLRVKYIYRDKPNALQDPLHRRSTLKSEPHIREVTNFREIQKAVLPKILNAGTINTTNCRSCICDLEEAVEEMKKILTLKAESLVKIVDYECTKFENIGDEIVLFSTGIIGDVLPRSRRDLAEARGMKYVKPDDVEEALKNEINEGRNENEIMSFPGSDLNVPCNHDGEDITWLTSISKPNYTWVREDGLPVPGMVTKNGNLELYEVDAKDTGNYTCFVNYIDPDNEELVQNIYFHRIQVVTLPRYTLRGGNRYRLQNCDETELDVLASHLPKKLNDILCKGGVCDAFIYVPRCNHQQISIRTLVVPSSTAKLFPIGPHQCGLHCRKAVQDKVALLLSTNLRNVLRKSIVFRLPHRPRDRLVPIESENYQVTGNRRGRRNGNRADADGEVGLLVGCPAGYGLHDSHCLPCKPGSHSDNLGSKCKSCPSGTHQPNTGARTCRACTNPFVEGCYEMLWNSSSALLAILASLCAVLTIFTILVWMLCCGKGRKTTSDDSCARSTEVELKYQTGDRSVRQPLIEQSRELSDEDERCCDCEKIRKKKKRFMKKKLLSRGDEEQEILAHRPERRQRSVRDRSDQKTERIKTVPISSVNSYRSHGGCRNFSPKKYEYGKPPLPPPDFPR